MYTCNLYSCGGYGIELHRCKHFLNAKWSNGDPLQPQIRKIRECVCLQNTCFVSTEHLHCVCKTCILCVRNTYWVLAKPIYSLGKTDVFSGQHICSRGWNQNCNLKSDSWNMCLSISHCSCWSPSFFCNPSGNFKMNPPHPPLQCCCYFYSFRVGVPKNTFVGFAMVVRSFSTLKWGAWGVDCLKCFSLTRFCD